MKILSRLTSVFVLFVFSIAEENWAGPDFLVIGAMKSGTSSLLEYLVDHPQIKKGKEKEIHFFDKYFSKGVEWYETQFPKKEENSDFLTGEATPAYLLFPSIPKKVYELYPDVKLIVILRNPVDRAFSNHKMNLRNGKNVASFEDRIFKELKTIEKHCKNRN
ncbi:MAG: sulfotransferase domain-containing protein, partial [Bacteroidota bacterium]